MELSPTRFSSWMLDVILAAPLRGLLDRATLSTLGDFVNGAKRNNKLALSNISLASK